jgi:chromosome partitioning protein
VQGPSHYSELVLEARRQRQLIDQRTTDWVVVRNRLTQLETRNRRNMETGLEQLGARIGFRVVASISDRVVFRELFPLGLTALDTLNQKLLGGEPTLSHLSARDEIRSLIAGLNLPGATLPAEPAVAKLQAALPLGPGGLTAPTVQPLPRRLREAG